MILNYLNISCGKLVSLLLVNAGDMSSVEDQEIIVKESLLSFLQENIPQANLRCVQCRFYFFPDDLKLYVFWNSFVDEIVLSYVVSILEELGSESGHEELFDVESFSKCHISFRNQIQNNLIFCLVTGEMLTAYFPEFVSVPHVAICDWMFKLSAQISKSKQGTPYF